MAASASAVSSATPLRFAPVAQLGSEKTLVEKLANLIALIYHTTPLVGTAVSVLGSSKECINFYAKALANDPESDPKVTAQLEKYSLKYRTVWTAFRLSQHVDALLQQFLREADEQVPRFPNQSVRSTDEFIQKTQGVHQIVDFLRTAKKTTATWVGYFADRIPYIQMDYNSALGKTKKYQAGYVAAAASSLSKLVSIPQPESEGMKFLNPLETKEEDIPTAKGQQLIEELQKSPKSEEDPMTMRIESQIRNAFQVNGIDLDEKIQGFSFACISQEKIKTQPPANPPASNAPASSGSGRSVKSKA